MAKKVLSVTIDEKLLKDWKEHVDKECKNSSQLIQKILKEHLGDRLEK